MFPHTSGSVRQMQVKKYLTEQSVLEIFAARPRDGVASLTPKAKKQAMKEVVGKYGVSSKTVQLIWNRKCWAKLTEPFWDESERAAQSEDQPSPSDQGTGACESDVERHDAEAGRGKGEGFEERRPSADLSSTSSHSTAQSDAKRSEAQSAAIDLGISTSDCVIGRQDLGSCAGVGGSARGVKGGDGAGAQGEQGADDVQVGDVDGQRRVRVDRVGVEEVVGYLDRTRSEQGDAGAVGEGRFAGERERGSQDTGDDDARGGQEGDDRHPGDESGAHWLRGDRVGVDDVGGVSGRTRGEEGDTGAAHDGREVAGEGDTARSEVQPASSNLRVSAAFDPEITARSEDLSQIAGQGVGVHNPHIGASSDSENSLLDAIEMAPSLCSENPFTVDWESMLAEAELETMVAAEHFAAPRKRNRSEWNYNLLLLEPSGSSAQQRAEGQV